MSGEQTYTFGTLGVCVDRIVGHYQSYLVVIGLFRYSGVSSLSQTLLENGQFKIRLKLGLNVICHNPHAEL